jgi:hypothetical protein
MQAKFTRESDFRQERDFGAKIGATFEFLGAHWRPLGRCLLYFVLPPTLLMGVALGISQTQAFDNINVLPSAGLLLSTVAYSLMGATVYGYVLSCLRLESDQDVSPRVVWEQVRRLVPRFLLASVVAGVLLILGFMVLLIPGIYLLVPLSLMWIVQAFENQAIGGAISRSISLARGKWWSTFGLMFVLTLLLGILNVVFQLPQLLATLSKMMRWSWLASDVFIVACNVVSSAASMLLYTPLFVALLFQYFNLVERKEGVGLRSLVNSLGTAPAPVAHDQAYRPDDDGEY